MKEAKFNYYGHLSLGGQIALLIVFCVVLVFVVNSWKPMEMQEMFILVFFSLVSITFWLANNILTNLKRLEFKDGLLIITHLVTKKVQKIKLKEVVGYKFNELTLKTQLIDLQGKTVATIYNPFYKELNVFLLEKNIKQIDTDERYLRGLTI